MTLRFTNIAYYDRLFKLFLPIVVIYAVLLTYTTYINNSSVQLVPTKLSVLDQQEREYKIKYILQWTNKTTAPFQFMGEGNSTFVKNKCKHTNCFVTDDRSFMDVTEFDAIIFNGRNVIYMDPSELPERRSPKQKYIIAATESSDRFPACNEVLDDFFNWTWTYKLTSDLRFGYITVYNLNGTEVGPAVDMKWPEMEPITEDLKVKLSHKSKAAAWFVSHCKTNSKREDFVAEINEELKEFGWNVDIYGSCGRLNCTRKNWRDCDKKVKEEYYFYFSFENSFAEDYVTEKMLTALNNNAVPVAFGGCNYSRFLPPCSYLNAKDLGAKNLARTMNDLINDKNKYYEYFRWKNHFTFKQTLTTTDMCKLCEALNDFNKVETVSTWKNFRRWWNGANGLDKCL